MSKSFYDYCIENNRLDLLAQWCTEQNSPLSPKTVAPRSANKVWWRCEKGHEWQASIITRSRGTSCPVCANKKIIVGENDLATAHPELARQWHQALNGALTPEMISPGSNKKVWWQCEKGHEWQASVVTRSRGTGCPVCANKKIIVGENDLASKFPEIAAQWHPTKNGDLTPDKVAPFSSKQKVWWRCELGHDYLATILSRTAHNTGCPYCSGRKVLANFNDLATKDPMLATQWHQELNGNLTPEMVSPGSKQKVWWRCEKGHEWQTAVFTRSRQGAGCPVCANKKRIVGENNLATTHPELARQWHQELNDELAPEMISPGSNKKVWWRCEKGHEWQASVFTRSHQGAGCPVCTSNKTIAGENDLATTHPEIARQWHPTKNGDLTPDKVAPLSSKKKVWWRCELGHDYLATISSRTVGNTGCPYCTGQKVLAGFNDLAAKDPMLATQWHQELNGNLTPEMVSPGSKQKVWWQCEKGHEWQASVVTRSRGTGCPVCANKKIIVGENDLATTHPMLATQWHQELNGELTPEMVTPGSSKKVWWQCPNGHVWQTRIYTRATGRKHGCPVCAGVTNTKRAKRYREMERNDKLYNRDRYKD